MPWAGANLRQQIKELLRANRSPLETLVANVVLTAAILIVAVAAGDRMTRLKENGAKIDAVQSALSTWPGQFAQASAVERQEWARASADVARLGVRPQERLFLAQLLSKRAEDAGIFDARVTFSSATAGAEGRRGGSREFRSAAYGVQVDCSASFPAVVEFIAQLPAAVSITSLGMQRTEGGLRAQFALQVFEPAEGVR